MLFGVRLVRVHSNRLNSKCLIEDLGTVGSTGLFAL